MRKKMTDRTDDWRTIFGDLTTDGVYEMCEINAYQLTAHLEELYLQNQELKERIESLEKDNELLKSYAWEQ
jgi:cell division protein FtsB